MNLSEIFIRRPVMTIMIMCLVAFFGVFAYKTLPVSTLPDVEYPTINISVSYPGANPQTMANNVVVPLENEFMTIPGVQTISSSSSTGSATIVIQFDLNREIDSAAQDVQAAINAATDQLPSDLPFAPTYNKVNPSASPILYLAFTSPTLTESALYDYGDIIVGRRLGMIDGVAQVFAYGKPYAVRVQLDPQKLAAKGLCIDDAANAIRDANVNIPTGTLYGQKVEFNLNVSGQLNVAEQYKTLIIKQENGALVRLSDVSHTFDSVREDKSSINFYANNTHLPAVVLAVQKQPGTNTLEVTRKVVEQLDIMEEELPGSITLTRIFFQSTFINEAIEEVENTLLLAIFLVVVVIFVYLGKIKDTIIPSIAIPMSLLGTFIAMLLLGYTIDILSLLGLTLAIGFLVDDAIVVLENIVRHVEMGEPPLQAALNGTKEISLTVLSMTISLASVFIPLIFMGGTIGRILHEFGMVIVIAILMSGFVSLSLTPLLCYRFIPVSLKEIPPNPVERFSEKLNKKLVGFYRKTLEWALCHQKKVLVTALLTLLLSITLYIQLPKDFVPNDDIGFIVGATQMADSTSPFEMMRQQEKIAEIVRQNPHVFTLVSVAASGSDNTGAFYARLKPLKERPNINKVIEELYVSIGNIPGVRIFMRPIPLINLDVGTGSSRGDYQLSLQSLDANDLYTFAPLLVDKISKIPGIGQVNSDLEISQPQANLVINRDRASLLNVSAKAIESTLNFAYSDTLLSTINTPNSQYYVILETLPEFYKNPEALSQLWVRSSKNLLIPLNEVTKLSTNVAPMTISHLNGLPSTLISFNLRDIPLGDAINTINKITKETLPPTVMTHFQGAASAFKSSFANLGFLFLITLFLIYAILAILYENPLPPLTVMSTLPPAALGALLSLYATGNTFSLYAFVGLMMLLGIVMKNGIIMIDFANEWRIHENKSAHDAIFHACVVRFRPILMTTLAAMMGAMPIALGLGGSTAETRRPLGIVIVGGLIFSQILTLYLTPVTYITLERLKERWTARKKRLTN